MARKKPDKSDVDAVIRGLACATVVGLAGIAAAISYSHMHELAVRHGESGWRGHAFPLSVDGIELTASLVLLAHRRAGTKAEVLPWVALGAGTLASLAANVAVGAVDLIGRAVAGWPAIALLVAIKMLAGLLDGGSTKDTADSEQAAASMPAPAVADDLAARRRRRARRTSGRSGVSRESRGSGAEGPDLKAAARAALAELTAAGQRLSRDSLTRALRASGHTVSNAKAGELLTLLRQAPVAPVNGTRPDLVPVDGRDGDA